MVRTKRGESPLATLAGKYLTLNEDERELLGSLNDQPRRIARNSEVVREGRAADNLFVVQSGWLLSYTIMPDGRRQVLQVHFPGDIIGFCDMPLPSFTYELKSLTDCSLCMLTQTHVQDIFHKTPRLTGFLFSLMMVDQKTHTDRLRVLGRMNARERVIHFLLSTLVRLRMIDQADGDIFDFPLTQFDLADAVGLTNVSVSNALSGLQEQGVLKRSSGKIQILDEAYMREAVSFINRFESIDISWFPYMPAEKRK